MSTLQKRIKEAFYRLPHDRQVKSRLAKHCGISAPSVADWFNGRTKVLRLDHLELAAEYLQVDPMWLLRGVGSWERSEYKRMQEKGPESDLPTVLASRGLTSIQSATVEALVDALSAGAYTDEQCTELLAEHLRAKKRCQTES